MCFDRCYCTVSGIIISVQGSELISITAFNLFFSSVCSQNRISSKEDLSWETGGVNRQIQLLFCG